VRGIRQGLGAEKLVGGAWSRRQSGFEGLREIGLGGVRGVAVARRARETRVCADGEGGSRGRRGSEGENEQKGAEGGHPRFKGTSEG